MRFFHIFHWYSYTVVCKYDFFFVCVNMNFNFTRTPIKRIINHFFNTIFNCKTALVTILYIPGNAKPVLMNAGHLDRDTG